jgi:excisionase family DNA binding protein
VTRPTAPPSDLASQLRALADQVEVNQLDDAEIVGKLETIKFTIWASATTHAPAAPAPDERPPLTVADVSRRVGFSTDVVYEMLRRGELTNVGRGRSKRVAAAEVDAWLAGRNRWRATVHSEYSPPRDALGCPRAARAARDDAEGARRRTRCRHDDGRPVGTRHQSRRSPGANEPDTPGAAAWSLRPHRSRPASPADPET